MASSLDFDPFATHHIVTLPELKDEQSTTWDGFRITHDLHTDIFCLDEPEHKILDELQSGSFRAAFDDAPLPELDAFSASVSQSDLDDREAEYETSEELAAAEDIWKLPEVLISGADNRLTSWDHFLQEDHKESCSPYLSERGPATFDALLRLSKASQVHSPVKYANPDAFLDALFELCSGRESKFFRWDVQQKTFSRTIDGCSLSGLSLALIDSAIDSFAQVGRRVRLLESFVECTLQDPTCSPTCAAFSAAESVCLSQIHAFFGNAKHASQSLLQIQEMMHPTSELTSQLQGMAEIVMGTLPEVQILASLMRIAQDSHLRQSAVDDVLQNVVARTLQPYLQRLSAQIGLLDPIEGLTCDTEEDKLHENAYESALRALLPIQVSRLVSETKLSLSILRDAAPEMLLRFRELRHADDAALALVFTWDDIVHLQTQAGAFESRAKKAISRMDAGDALHSASEDASDDLAVDDLPTIPSGNPFSFEHITTTLSPSKNSILSTLRHDRLSELVDETLSKRRISFSAFTFDVQQSLAFSLNLLVSVQHRLVSYSVLRLLFESHDVKSHIQLQYSFQLFGDGLFASRLSQALFDSDQASGEGRRRTSATTGLRLQSRETWPPASSELRLALMGILSESIEGRREEVLNECISFSIRELSDDELEQCRDLSSISALDFLRLQYKAPSTILESVITPECLIKYDRIFKHLLRILRFKAVAQSLLRDVCGRGQRPSQTGTRQKLRFEIQHFAATLASYCQDTAIGLPWRRFCGLLDRVQDALKTGDYAATLRLAGSLDQLRRTHDEMLDDMLRGLFLKRKQVEIRTVLEDVVALVLRFAASSSQEEGEGEGGKNDEMMTDEIRRGISQFLDCLSARAGQTAQESDLAADGAGSFEHLRFRLDMYGYWRSTPEV